MSTKWTAETSDPVARGLMAGFPPADDKRVQAEGNPFYVGELLRTLEEERVLCAGDAGWRLGDLRGVQVPPLLRQVIDGRVARLGERARHLLRCAAVIGQVVPLDLWAAVAETTDESAIRSVTS